MYLFADLQYSTRGTVENMIHVTYYREHAMYNKEGTYTYVSPSIPNQKILSKFGTFLIKTPPPKLQTTATVDARIV